MFATFRKHQKWLWAAIIAVIIPSFVIFFTNDVSWGGGGRSANFGTVYGRPISQSQMAAAYHETQLFFFLNYGSWPGGNEASRFGFDMDTQSRTRILMIDQLGQNKVHVDHDTSAKWVSGLFRDRRDGRFHPEAYEQFVKNTLHPQGISEEVFQNFVSHQAAIQHLSAVMGLNGKLVTPKEAELFYRKEKEQYEAEAVVFSSSNFLASISIKPDDLARFYTNRANRYRIPEKVQVRYIHFNATNYLTEALGMMSKDTNFSRRIDELYVQRGTNYYTDTNGIALPADAAKAKIKDQIQHEFASQLALKNASVFATDLFKMPVATNALASDNLNALASSNKMTVQISEPFTSDEPPAKMNVMDNFTRAAFALTPSDPFAQPLRGEDGVYVIALHSKIASVMPPLESIKAKVTEDYRFSQAILEAQRHGREVQDKLAAGVAQSKPIASILESEKVKPVSIPLFSLDAKSVAALDERIDLSSLKEAVANLQPGKPSRFVPNKDGGFVICLKAKHSVDDAELKKDLPEFLKSLRQSRQYEAFNAWLNRETQVALPVTKTAAN